MSDGTGFGSGLGGDAARLAAVRARHEDRLMRFPNVVGVSEGTRVRGGVDTGEPCLVVYVTHKVPPAELGEADVLPSELDGVPVDVRAVGRIEAQPS